MSLRLWALNLSLRWLEKPNLVRATPQQLRHRFERKAWLLFHPPKGTEFSDQSIAGVGANPTTLHWVQPKKITLRGVILYLHGGGFVFGSPRTHRAMVARLAAEVGCRACLPSYRLAPENPFPAAFNDALAAYDALLHLGYLPGQIVLGGDSAGGGLALSLLYWLLSQGRATPAGVFALSPVTDLTFSGVSFVANAHSDVVLHAVRCNEGVDMYLDGHNPRDPRVSPLFGDFAGAPPVYLTVGDREIFLDDTRRMTRLLSAAGAEVTCIVCPNLPHVWTLFAGFLPQADSTLRGLATFVHQVLAAGEIDFCATQPRAPKV